ncbi:MAG: flagellar motor switch protein FliN [Pirellulaceae bacterium]
MAGESPTPRQEDIEDLLRQAQVAAGISPETSAAAPAAQAPPVAEEESPAGELGPAPVAAAVATATAPPPRAVPRPAASDVGDDIQFLLAQAEQAIAAVDRPIDPALEKLSAFEFKDLTGSPPSGEKATLELLKDVDLNLRIELGRTQMFLEDVLKLRRGSVVALDKLAGDPVDVFVNGRIVARGEVLVLNDNFCVRVTELLAGDDFD